MNLVISQGQAIRSVLGRARVIHFMTLLPATDGGCGRAAGGERGRVRVSPPGGCRAGSCRWWCRAGAQRGVAGGLVVVGDDFADGGAGDGVVEEGFAAGPAGEQGLPADVVDGPGVAAADLVNEGDRVLCEERCITSADLQVVPDVGGGFGFGHAAEVVSHGYALVEGR